MILFNMEVTMQIFYLTIILLIIKYGLKNLEFIEHKYILLYLIIISFLVNFIFYGISLSTIFESLVSVSFVVFIEEIYKIFTNKSIYWQNALFLRK